MIGFRILPRTRSVSDETIEKFKPLPVANISDCMWRLPAGGASIRPYHKGGVMAGRALTIKTRPGDNLMVHAALDRAVKGDVLVIDAGGALDQAIMGELMISQAIKKQVAGVVINGAIRDVAWIRERDFPVFAAGVTHRGPYKDGPGEINCTLAINSMVIEPGDLIIGDDDGFLAVPYAQTEELYAATVKKHAAENRAMEEILAGTHSRAWVNDTLKKLGCEF